MMNATILLTAAVLTAGAAGWLDHRTGKMPNVLTLSSLGLACAVQLFGGGGDALTRALVGALAAGGIPLALFLASRGRAIGGGDVKALAAIGAWLGPTWGLEILLSSLLIMAILALVQQALAGHLVPLLARTWLLLLPSFMDQGNGAESPTAESLTEMRFGPSLALGTLFVCGSHLVETMR